MPRSHCDSAGDPKIFVQQSQALLLKVDVLHEYPLPADKNTFCGVLRLILEGLGGARVGWKATLASERERLLELLLTTRRPHFSSANQEIPVAGRTKTRARGDWFLRRATAWW